MFAPLYKELTVKTKIIRVTHGIGELSYVPDLPKTTKGFGLILCFVDGVNYYAYPLPASTEGKECIAHVVYHAEDDEAMQKFAGKLGKGNEVCKLKAYKDIVKQTVGEKYIADEKQKLIQEAEAKGEIVSKEELDKVDYKLPDKDDGAPLWVFNMKEYVDK